VAPLLLLTLPLFLLPRNLLPAMDSLLARLPLPLSPLSGVLLEAAGD